MAIITPLASNANKTTSYINNAFAKNSGNTLSNQLGVNAKAPAPATSGNTTIKPNMSVAPNMSPAFIGPMDTNSEATKVKNMQTQLNAKNAGQPGWTPLQVDGILGPKTKAAQSFKPTTTNSGTTGGSSYSSGSTTGGSYQSQPLQYQPSQYQAPAQQQPAQSNEMSQNQALLLKLAQLGGTSTPEYKAALDKANSFNDALLKSRTNQAHGLAENAMNPIPLQFQQGRAQVLQNQYGQEQAALGAAYNAATAQQGQANTQQGLQQGAVTTALNATMPQMQFGMLTNPQTGEIVGGQGSNAQQLMGSSLQKAQQMFANGSSFEDAIAQSGLAQFGNLGSSLLSSAIMSGGGGGYNPTAYNTQVGANMQNLSNTQIEAYKVGQNLQQVKALESVMLDYLQKSGVNPSEAQVYNGPINNYLSKIGNPGAAANWALQMGDLKNYTSQLMASGYGGTPTGAESAMINQDPSKLSYKDLKAYLETLSRLGSNRLNVLQRGVGDLGGTSAGFSGNQAQQYNSVPVPAASTGALGTGINSPTLQALAGGALEYGPSAVDAAATGAFAGASAKLVPLFLKLLKFL